MDIVDCPIVVSVIDWELDSVIKVSLVTASVSKVLSVTLWDVAISEETVGLAVLVVKISVAVSDTVSAKQE